MTNVLHRSSARPAAWSGMPGWSIVADLTPPELRARRSLGTLRRAIAAGLVLTLGLCVAGYLLAGKSEAGAQSDLNSANARSDAIRSQISKHSEVTQIEIATTAIRSQLSTLMASDVDVSSFVQLLMRDLPTGMSITSVNIDLTADQAASDTTTAGTPASVGTVTLGGKSSNLAELAQYASALNGQPGIVGVLPTSNSAGPGGGAWSLTLDITAKRYTHRYGTAPSAPATPSTPAATGGN